MIDSSSPQAANARLNESAAAREAAERVSERHGEEHQPA